MLWVVDNRSSKDDDMDSDKKEGEDSTDDEEEFGDEEDLVTLVPTPKRSKLTQAKGMSTALSYSPFEGIKGPFQDLPPQENSTFDYLQLLWPVSLHKLIASETNY